MTLFVLLQCLFCMPCMNLYAMYEFAFVGSCMINMNI